MATKAELMTKLAEAEARAAKLNTLANDRLYLMEAYQNMLGENGLKVVALWRDSGVKRIHFSWGPDALKMTGEERAAFILELEASRETGVRIENVDGF